MLLKGIRVVNSDEINYPKLEWERFKSDKSLTSNNSVYCKRYFRIPRQAFKLISRARVLGVIFNKTPLKKVPPTKLNHRGISIKTQLKLYTRKCMRNYFSIRIIESFLIFHIQEGILRASFYKKSK